MERHRHRYEVNPELVSRLTAAGLLFTGVDDRGTRMEVIELPRDKHPFYFAAQFHPEFKSHPTMPSPPFLGLVLAACGRESLDALLTEAAAAMTDTSIVATKYACSSGHHHYVAHAPSGGVQIAAAAAATGKC